jgi:hypothetical protein
VHRLCHSLAGHETAESGVPQLGDSLCGQRCLLSSASSQWLAKIREAGVRRRTERLYEQLDMLQHLRQQARRELLAKDASIPSRPGCDRLPIWDRFARCWPWR